MSSLDDNAQALLSSNDGTIVNSNSPQGSPVNMVLPVTVNTVNSSPLMTSKDTAPDVGEQLTDVEQKDEVKSTEGMASSAINTESEVDGVEKNQDESSDGTMEAHQDQSSNLAQEEGNDTKVSMSSKEMTQEDAKPQTPETLQTQKMAQPQNPESTESLPVVEEVIAAHPDAEEASSTGEKKDEDDIEWLSPFSLPRLKDETGSNNDGEGTASGQPARNSFAEPLKMLKKGAVAAVGGTMVGVGLVMIPLPTPFGAAVASSGLAVLGSEFDQAKELNDKLIDGAKGHLNTARDAMVKGIEKMNQDNFDADGETKNLRGSNHGSVGDSSVTDKEGSAIQMNASTSTIGSEFETTETSINNEEDPNQSAPVWLHMNSIERERQERLAREKYRRENQTSYEQAKEAFTKRTGRFLSKNILPLIKKKDQTPVTKVEEPSTGNVVVDDGSSSDGVIVIASQGETSQSSEPTMTEAKSESKNTNEIDGGYIVVRPEDKTVSTESQITLSSEEDEQIPKDDSSTPKIVAL